MDLHMPGCDGDEACLQIKGSPLSRATPVVMVTSSDSPKDIERCRLAKCDEVLQKPITRENVLELSKKYLALPAWPSGPLRVYYPLVVVLFCLIAEWTRD